jgi:hypothetical protein
MRTLKPPSTNAANASLATLRWSGVKGKVRSGFLVQVGDAEGLDRKEVFINAKDQRWEEELSEQEYIDVLIQKGWQSLQPEVEFFESEVDVNGSTRIRQDFDLGDTVSIEMSQWNMQIHVQVTEISEVFDEMGLRVIPIFGQSLGGMQNQFESDTSGSGSSSTISLPINKAVISDSNGQLTTRTRDRTGNSDAGWSEFFLTKSTQWQTSHDYRSRKFSHHQQSNRKPGSSVRCRWKDCQ